MKNFYAVACDLIDDKYRWNYVIKVSDNVNALFEVNSHGFYAKNHTAKREIVNFFATKKRAKEIAGFWNECAIKNGDLFDFQNMIY